MSTIALPTLPPVTGTSASCYTASVQSTSIDLVINDEYEGYSRAQFERAVKLASKSIARKAKRAAAKGTIGTEATKKLMESILNADS